MDEQHLKRVAVNESLFRGHNEAIRSAVTEFRALADEDEAIGFMCECAVTECEETVELTAAQYAEVRSDPGWFVVKPEHMLPAAEDRVRDHGTYWIVAKHGTGRRVAEELAPDGR